MTDKAISPLRQRMIEDMTIRKLALKTQHDVQRVKNFAAFLGRSPDTASFEDVRRYQLHLAKTRQSISDAQRRFSLSRSAEQLRHPLDRFQKKRSMHVGNRPPTPKSP